ncbi:fimbrial protein, partial [Salmonella enterica]|nr:fimbrial protein [Salmonella enterica]
FHGDVGIAPRIDFHGHVDFEHFIAGFTTLSLDVKDKAGAKIGTMTTKFLAGGEASTKNSERVHHNFIISQKPGQAFYGGITTSVDPYQVDGIISGVKSIFGSELTANYTDQGGSDHMANTEPFNDEQAVYSAYYGGGIAAGQSIKLALDREAAGDEPIKWHASLPVTVSYQ